MTTNPPTAAGHDVLSKSIKGASFLILLQFSSRALTFVVNQVLLRFLSPELLGISTQLELYSITVLYFARESLRVALQRYGDGSEQDPAFKVYISRQRAQEVVNLSYIAIVLGFPLSLIFGYLYLGNVEDAVLNTPYFRPAFLLYAAAVILELLSEPCFEVAQQQLLYGIRASAEGVATFSRSALLCGLAVWSHRNGVDLGALPFAAGQMCYAVLLTAVYFSSVGPVVTSMRVSLFLVNINLKSRDYVLALFPKQPLNLAMAMYGQSALKHILTQGDSILVQAFLPLSAQGTYALASNYGSLLARIVFQPIEESSRTVFGRLLADRRKLVNSSVISEGDSSPSHNFPEQHEMSPEAKLSQVPVKEKSSAFRDNTGKDRTVRMSLQTSEERENPSETVNGSSLSKDTIQTNPAVVGNEQQMEQSFLQTDQQHLSPLESAKEYLLTLLRLYNLLNLVLLSVGPVCLPLAMTTFIGPRWASTSAPSVLALYSYYLPLLAVNGLLEAFVSAVATPAQLKQQSIAMISLSISFAAVGVFYIREAENSAQGLVIVNCANMIARILWSWTFVKKWFSVNGRKISVSEAVPRFSVLIFGAITRVVMDLLSRSFNGRFTDLIKAGLLASSYVIALSWLERGLLISCYRMFRGSGNATKLKLN